ncbi:MAG TPA: cyclodeaminase/cyclohydrolase family protein [Actinomycetota bacterium]
MSDLELGSLSVEGFCEVLASDSPTPGGGAVGAIEAAAAASLIAMVGRLTVDKAGFEDLAERMRAMIVTADAAQADFLHLADRDAHAFDSVMEAFRMPKETDEDKAARSAAIQAGYLAAASVPQEVARKAVDLMELAEDATAMGNPQAASDGLSAAASLYAGALCAIANVEINASSLKDVDTRATMLAELASLKARADQSLRESQTAFQLRLAP